MLESKRPILMTHRTSWMLRWMCRSDDFVCMSAFREKWWFFHYFHIQKVEQQTADISPHAWLSQRFRLDEGETQQLTPSSWFKDWTRSSCASSAFSWSDFGCCLPLSSSKPWAFTHTPGTWSIKLECHATHTHTQTLKNCLPSLELLTPCQDR